MSYCLFCRIAFAMRTTDDAGNTAEISNIAMMSLFLTPPPIACADDKGRPISTDPFEKPGDCTHFYQVHLLYISDMKTKKMSD